MNVVLELKKQGWSKYRIAKTLNVSYNAVIMWEKGVYKPNIENLKKLQELLKA